MYETLGMFVTGGKGGTSGLCLLKPPCLCVYIISLMPSHPRPPAGNIWWLDLNFLS